INEGKEIIEKDNTVNQRKKPHTYRKNVPYSHSEALQMALNALEAYFIEQPLYAKVAIENISNTNLMVSNPKQLNSFAKYELDKNISEFKEDKISIEIEIQTETQMPQGGKETVE